MTNQAVKRHGVRWVLNAGFTAILLLVVTLTMVLDGIYRNALTEQITAQELERIDQFNSRLTNMEESVRDLGIGYLQMLRKKQTLTLAEAGSTILALLSSDEHAFLDSVYLREPNGLYAMVSFQHSGDVSTWWLPFARAEDAMSDQEAVELIRNWEPGDHGMPVMRTIVGVDQPAQVLTYILPLHSLVPTAFNRVMVVNVRCDWIAEQLMQSTLGSAYVINARNQVVASSLQSGAAALEDIPLEQVWRQKTNSGCVMVDIRGVRTALIYRRLGKTGYTAVELVAVKDISPVLDDLFRKAIIFCLLVCMLCVLVNLLLSRLIARPMAAMSSRLSEMEEQARAYNDSLRRAYYRAVATGQMDQHIMSVPGTLDARMQDLFQNGVFLAGVLWMDGELTDERLKQFISAFGTREDAEFFKVSRNRFLAVIPSQTGRDVATVYDRLANMVGRSGYIALYPEAATIEELYACNEWLRTQLNEARFFDKPRGDVQPVEKTNQTAALSGMEKQLIAALREWDGQKAGQCYREIVALGQKSDYAGFRQFLIHLCFETTYALSAMAGASLRQKRLLETLQVSRVLDTVAVAKTASEISALFLPVFDQISHQDIVPNHREILRQKLRMVETDYSNPLLSLVMLAEDTGLSASYFGKLFIAYQGMPVSEFISQTRIKAACRMLRDTREPIEGIARACGFENTKYFYSVFKKQMHMTPREYRQAAWHDAGEQALPQTDGE